jgi:hypothetical protein
MNNSPPILPPKSWLKNLAEEYEKLFRKPHLSEVEENRLSAIYAMATTNPEIDAAIERVSMELAIEQGLMSKENLKEYDDIKACAREYATLEPLNSPAWQPITHN